MTARGLLSGVPAAGGAEEAEDEWVEVFGPTSGPRPCLSDRALGLHAASAVGDGTLSLAELDGGQAGGVRRLAVSVSARHATDEQLLERLFPGDAHPWAAVKALLSRCVRHRRVGVLDVAVPRLLGAGLPALNCLHGCSHDVVAAALPQCFGPKAPGRPRWASMWKFHSRALLARLRAELEGSTAARPHGPHAFGAAAVWSRWMPVLRAMPDNASREALFRLAMAHPALRLRTELESAYRNASAAGVVTGPEWLEPAPVQQALQCVLDGLSAAEMGLVLASLGAADWSQPAPPHMVCLRAAETRLRRGSTQQQHLDAVMAVIEGALDTLTLLHVYDGSWERNPGVLLARRLLTDRTSLPAAQLLRLLALLRRQWSGARRPTAALFGTGGSLATVLCPAGPMGAALDSWYRFATFGVASVLQALARRWGTAHCAGRDVAPLSDAIRAVGDAHRLECAGALAECGLGAVHEDLLQSLQKKGAALRSMLWGLISPWQAVDVGAQDGHRTEQDGVCQPVQELVRQLLRTELAEHRDAIDTLAAAAAEAAHTPQVAVAAPKLRAAQGRCVQYLRLLIDGVAVTSRSPSPIATLDDADILGLLRWVGTAYLQPADKRDTATFGSLLSDLGLAVLILHAKGTDNVCQRGIAARVLPDDVLTAALSLLDAGAKLMASPGPRGPGADILGSLPPSVRGPVTSKVAAAIRASPAWYSAQQAGTGVESLVAQIEQQLSPDAAVSLLRELRSGTGGKSLPKAGDDFVVRHLPVADADVRRTLEKQTRNRDAHVRKMRLLDVLDAPGHLEDPAWPNVYSNQAYREHRGAIRHAESVRSMAWVLERIENEQADTKNELHSKLGKLLDAAAAQAIELPGADGLVAALVAPAEALAKQVVST